MCKLCVFGGNNCNLINVCKLFVAEYLKPHKCVQIICIRLEYLKLYKCIQIICIRRWFPKLLRRQSCGGGMFNPDCRQVTIQEYLTLVPGYG